jgi:nucleoid DNA-binding protein
MRTPYRCYDLDGMNKGELAKRLARQTHRSKAAAADELDRVVHQILTSLRRGEKARLPGLGTFVPGAQPGFEFEADERARNK